MKEIKNRWVGLAVWLLLIGVFWFVGEALHWQGRGGSANEKRAWLALVGVLGVLAFLFNKDDKP